MSIYEHDEAGENYELEDDLYGAKRSAAIAAKIIADCERRISE